MKMKRALLLGVALAVWSGTTSYRALRPDFLSSRPLLRAACFLLLLITLAAVTAAQGLSIRTGIISCICACLVLLASHNRGLLIQDGVMRRLLTFLGARSYGLYLIHGPAFFLTREIWYKLSPENAVFGPEYSLRFLAAGLLLLFLLNEINYRFVEVPLRLRGRAIAERFEGSRPRRVQSLSASARAAADVHPSATASHPSS